MKPWVNEVLSECAVDHSLDHIKDSISSGLERWQSLPQRIKCEC